MVKEVKVPKMKEVGLALIKVLASVASFRRKITIWSCLPNTRLFLKLKCDSNKEKPAF